MTDGSVKWVKLKKENELSLSELMQYDIYNKLEYISGLNSNEIIEDYSSYFSMNYDFKWYLNGTHRLGVDCQVVQNNTSVLLDTFLFHGFVIGSAIEGYLVTTDFGIGSRKKFKENQFRINIYGTNL